MRIAMCGAAVLLSMLSACGNSGGGWGTEWKTPVSIKERCISQLEDEFIDKYMRRSAPTLERQAEYQDIVTDCCPKMEEAATPLSREQRTYLWYEMSARLTTTSDLETLAKHRAEADRRAQTLSPQERAAALDLKTSVFASCRHDVEVRHLTSQ